MRSLMLLIFVVFLGSVHAQVRSLEFTVLDKETSLPISGAHIFVGNSTFGTSSDKDGNCAFDIPMDVTMELFASHVAYDDLLISHNTYSTFGPGDTIYLEPNYIDLSSLGIDGKRAKQWKQNYRKFSKAFIGTGKRAVLCEIINPQVLRFSNEEGIFTATAIDVLKIKNHYLGYDISFLMKELTIDKDGSMRYTSYSKFTDRSLTSNRAEIDKNRKESYEKSTNHFVLSMIADDLDQSNYKIGTKQHKDDALNELESTRSRRLVSLDSVSGFYHIAFEDYLEVVHLDINQIKDKRKISAGLGRDSRLFGANNEEDVVLGHPVSMIYKSDPYLVVDKYGIIRNQESVQKYGYWTEHSIADLLPFDYGFVVESAKTAINESKTERNPVAELDTTSLSITHALLYGDKNTRTETLSYIERTWKDSYIPMLLDINKMITSEELNPRIIELLVTKAEIFNYFDGLQWMWSDEPVYDNYYLDNKAEIYQHIDPVFRSYFIGQQSTARISLDEIVWGGVKSNSIPQLKLPKMINADAADYLNNNDIVFGIVINGEAKAYPKRILAWHEFFIDKIGEENVAGVYCTLCGTMIAYDMNHRKDIHELSTSGFLYRSNKLMVDKKTKSLWSTIDGEPVLGPLSNKGIKLKSFPVVTTKWKNWVKDHPETKVLSLDTGFDRNYAEGAAYKSYFSNDELMFPVPIQVERLDNKDEVLIIRSPRFKTDPLAISIKYLKKERIHQNTIADKNVLVITEKDGASRVFYSKNVKFKTYKKGVLTDVKGDIWDVNEEYLISKNGRKLLRAPSHNAFWFAWYNLYPKTRLVK